MAGTRITVALIVVLIQIINASKLMNVDSHQPAEKESPDFNSNLIKAMSRVLKARNVKENNLRQVKEKTMKRTSDPYAYTGGCYDNHDDCDYWASIGECFSNAAYMTTACQYSCETCCSDTEEQCGYWAATGECYVNPDYMNYHCQLSCGLCPGVNFKRDVTKIFGNRPPGTRDDSHKQLGTDDKIKQAYELGKFIKRAAQTWSLFQGNRGSPDSRQHPSK